MGVDSLMAVELQTIVKRDFGVSLQLTSFLEGISVAQLTTNLLEKLTLDGGPVPGTTSEPVVLAASKKNPPLGGGEGLRSLHRSDGVGSPATPQPTPGPDGPCPSQEESGLPLSFAHHTGYLSGLGVPLNTVEKGSAAQVAADLSSQLAESAPTDPLMLDLATVLSAGRPVTPVPPEPGSASAKGGKAIDYGSIDYSRWTPLQSFLKRALSIFFRVVARLEITGLDNIPHSGPVLLVCNHLSMIDVPLIVTLLPRRAICLAADELQDLPWVRWFLDLGDTIYVRRGEADQKALSRGLAVLRAGGMLGVSPEGTRSRTGGLARGRSGVAYLAAAAPASILPVAFYGQEQIPRNVKRLRRTTVHVRVGSLIDVEPGEKTAAQLRRDTERIMEAIAAMLPPAYRGIYTDGPEPPEPPKADAAAAR
jgi:1-acyl-sn-glycerol-3-phosphate acyltransferase